MTWKVVALEAQLLERHPDFDSVVLTDESIEIRFNEAPPMEVGEFGYGTKTRELLEELEDEMRDLSQVWAK